MVSQDYQKSKETTHERLSQGSEPADLKPFDTLTEVVSKEKLARRLNTGRLHWRRLEGYSNIYYRSVNPNARKKYSAFELKRLR